MRQKPICITNNVKEYLIWEENGLADEVQLGNT